MTDIESMLTPPSAIPRGFNGIRTPKVNRLQEPISGVSRKGFVRSLQVQPRATTTYKATWDNATSKPVVVNLRPRLTFQKVGRHQYLVVVLAAHSMAGKQLDIARRVGGTYVTYRHATITSIARTSTTSVAYFVTVVPAGTHLRAFLPKNQVGSDYLDGHSNFVVQ
jgi:hypothetical protein